MTAEEAKILAELNAATGNPSAILPEGYERYKTINDPNTGFNTEIYRKTGTNEYVVSFEGTGNLVDWANNTTLGNYQWNETNRANVLNELSGLGASDIAFSGRSLGGALAEYAAYDYLKSASESNAVPANTALATYNGLGGVDGLKDRYVTGSCHGVTGSGLEI